MGLSDLLNDPLLRQQTLRLQRFGLKFWVPLLIVWIFASWLGRSWAFDLFPMNLRGGIAVEFALTYFFYTVRVDVVLAIALQPFLWPRSEWKELHPQLLLAGIGTPQILRARVLPTVAVLAALNLLSSPAFYKYLIVDGTGLFIERKWEIVAGFALAILAMIEDLLFATICTLAAVRGVFRHPDAGRAVFSALGVIALCGLAIVLASGTSLLFFVLQSLLWNYYEILMSDLTSYLLLVMAPTLVMLFMELWLIRLVWQAAKQAINESAAGY